MNLISIEQATVLRLGIIFRPDGQIFLPDAIGLLADKFNFSVMPDTKQPKPQALEFFHGKHKDFAIGSLGIYNDGLIVKSQSDSRRIEQFLVELDCWARETLGIEFHPSTAVKYFHESALVVQFEARELKVIKKLTRIERAVSDKMLADSGIECDATFNGMSFHLHAKNMRTFKPAPLKFEQRAGTEPDMGYWFSSAPLSTQCHLDLLAEIASLT
jgi:hypothetical protein